ncbi:CdaR family transcriptional regulator [Streptomyces sp. JJ38]|uniref:PucR family transcriptional regulator n=1 Tax=Streptomyces sp. JJ38 TaxID=2738128 RepID=UPI001C58E1A4|nr:PucR family transcriptional regulator [Streptomyces sp. JJ38]MBW1596080.1 helix-turn-helix domain-containing protein [Streptomyces sp. JJ38]
MGTMAPPPASDEDEALRRDIERAWASLLPHADAIADNITLTLLAKDWYAGAGAELRAEIRASTRENIRRGIRTMAGLAEDDERAVHLWRETGRRRARQGVPMEQVLSAYSIGTRVLWEALLAQRGQPGLGVDDRTLLIAGQRIWWALDVQNTTLVESYRKESARLQRRDRQRQQRLLDGLVEGRGADPAFAAEARDVLGIATGDPVACVVACFDGTVDEPIRGAEERLERLGATSYWHVRGDVHVGLVATAVLGVDGLVRALRPAAAGRAVVAASADGLAGFALAYRLAAGAADTMPRGRAEVISVTERLPEVLLGASPEVTALLLEETVAPLLAQPPQQAAVLLDTLRALIAHHGSPTHAAEQLFCHRNTVIYRLRQIEQLTGRSLQDPRDRLLLALGELAAPPRPAAGVPNQGYAVSGGSA